MTGAWRIVLKSREQEAFSGEGARRFPGRWNHRGTAVVYLAGSLALGALETFVHLTPKSRGLVFATFRVEIPDGCAIEEIGRGSLPDDWRAQPPPDSCRDLGAAWARAGRCAVLSVPSAIVPPERNFVLNVAHADFERIKIHRADDFTFDPRLWK